MTAHPAWCSTPRCTAILDSTGGQHRSAPARIPQSRRKPLLVGVALTRGAARTAPVRLELTVGAAPNVCVVDLELGVAYHFRRLLGELLDRLEDLDWLDPHCSDDQFTQRFDD